MDKIVKRKTQMKNKFLKGLVASFALAVSGFVQADLIISDSTIVDTSGDSYTSIFDITGFSDFEDVILSVEARGDYGDNRTDEFLEFWLDGDSLGTFSFLTSGSYWGGTGDESIDWILNFDVVISAAQWDVFSNDNSLTVSWSNSPAVGLFDNYHTSYVNYSINGTPAEVPEPSTVAIFALSLLGLASRKFKK